MALVWNPWAVAYLAAGLTTSAAALLIYRARPWRLQNRFLAIALATYALFLLGVWVMFSTTDPRAAWAAKSVWVLMLAGSTIPYLLFLTTFDSPLIRPLRSRWARRGLMIAAVVYPLALLPYVHVFSLDLYSPWFAPWYPRPHPQNLGRLQTFNAVVMFFGLAVLLTALRRAPPATAQRRRLAALTIALAVRDLPMAVLMSTYRFWREAQPTGDMVAIFAPPTVDLAFAVALTFAVLRYEILGVGDRTNEYVATQRHRRLAAYQSVLEISRAAGGGEREDMMLERLRRDLRLTEADHSRLAADVDATRTQFAAQRKGRFQIVRQLGEGGEGTAFLAKDDVLDRLVVLKQPHAGKRDRQEVLREARAAARVHHPNIVAIYEILADQDPFVLVLEYVEGETLQQRLDRSPLDVPEAVSIVDHVLRGLGALHAVGLVHGDIKPSNILLGTEGTVKIGDLGRAGKTGTMRTFGTPAFAAPEAGRSPLDARSDIWSCGSLLRAVIAGHSPDAATLDAGGSRGLSLPAELPEPLRRIVLKAQARDPDHRFQDADAMHVVLLAALPTRKAA